MKKRLFSILLCIVVCMAMMPLGVYGATTYNWTVNGIKVTSDNQDNVLGDETASVSYDPATYTLNLKNANIESISTGVSEAKINVEGSDNVVNSNGTGIYSSSKLTIKSNGSGKLTVTGAPGIECGGSLTFKDVEVDVQKKQNSSSGTNAYGICCNSDNITIENSIIKAAPTGYSYGIIAKNGVIIAKDAILDRSNVDFKSGETPNIYGSISIDNKFDKYAIWVKGVQVTSRNKDNITEAEGVGTGQKGPVYYEPDKRTLTLNNATINGEYDKPDGYDSVGAITSGGDIDINLIGKNTVTNSEFDGIYATKDITIAGDGSINVTGAKNGIHAKFGVYINSAVTAAGENGYGVYSESSSVGIYSTVTAKGSTAAISAAGGIGCSTKEIELKNGTLTDKNSMLKVKDPNANNGYAAISPVNYTLYYNADKGKMYKSYDNGTFSNEYTKGNWSSSQSKSGGKYDVLKLNNFEFETAAGTGLKIIGMDAGETFTIKGTGENHISIYGDNGYGIYTDGSLNFDGGRMYININEDTVASKAVYAGGDINLTDCELYDGVRAGSTNAPKGIFAGGQFVMENSYVRTNRIEANEGISACEYIYQMYLKVKSSGSTVKEVVAEGSEAFVLDSLLAVMFYSNDGTWKDNESSKLVQVSMDGNRRIILPEDPVREGYNFTGWFTTVGEVEGEVGLSDNAKYKISDIVQSPDSNRPTAISGERLKYYAHWKKLCKEHKFGSWTVTKQPTATAKGEKTRICSVCEYKETAEVPATGGGTVVAPVQKPEIAPVTGGDVRLSEDGTSLDITPADGMEIEKVTVNGKEVAVKDGRITGLKTGDKVVVTFVKKSPSKEDEYKDITDSINDLKLAVITSKTSKKNIKVKVKARKGSSLIKELESKGYTVKYKFYKSTKNASKYKAVKTKTSNTFINTNGKKGTRYYYKAKVLVYDGKKLVAQTVLKQCSYGARTWSK